MTNSLVPKLVGITFLSICSGISYARPFPMLLYFLGKCCPHCVVVIQEELTHYINFLLASFVLLLIVLPSLSTQEDVLACC